ncbi:MAG: alkaline phosphatase family protein [Thermoproteota archaeon]
MIILALDALDQNLVKAFHCKNLMQKEYGETDITVFDQPRTVVLWASFLTGQNMETKIPVEGQWSFQLEEEMTFLRFFDSHHTIDLPALSYKQDNHREERKLMKDFFDDQATVEEYDQLVWEHHQENKEEFLSHLRKHQLLIGYFNLADAIGHLSFGVYTKMRKVYQELDQLAQKLEKLDDFTLVISDHGMKAIGRFGDHTKHGYYSANTELNLNQPNITDFHPIIREVQK